MESNNGSNPFEIITIGLLGLAGMSGLILLRQKCKQGKIKKEQIFRFLRNAGNVVSVVSRHVNIACEEYKSLSNTGCAVQSTI